MKLTGTEPGHAGCLVITTSQRLGELCVYLAGVQSNIECLSTDLPNQQDALNAIDEAKRHLWQAAENLVLAAKHLVSWQQQWYSEGCHGGT